MYFYAHTDTHKHIYIYILPLAKSMELAQKGDGDTIHHWNA